MQQFVSCAEKPTNVCVVRNYGV